MPDPNDPFPVTPVVDIFADLPGDIPQSDDGEPLDAGEGC